MDFSYYRRKIRRNHSQRNDFDGSKFKLGPYSIITIFCLALSVLVHFLGS